MVHERIDVVAEGTRGIRRVEVELSESSRTIGPAFSL